MKISTLVILFFLSLFLSGQAQKKDIVSYSFRKGEVMDVMLLSTAPDSKDLYEKYKTTAFPVAFEYGYQPQVGFRISKLTLGNHSPQSIIFGKWKTKQKRESFLSDIVSKVPDFHFQRRALFPYFDLTYYEMSQDINFEINRKKYNVATSFWKGSSGNFANFFKEWKKKVAKLGGKIVIELQDGNSPVGYYYNPEVFCIVEWSDKSKFEAFENKNPLSSYGSLKNIHQFVID